MKKLLYALFVAVAIVSCTNEDSYTGTGDAVTFLAGDVSMVDGMSSWSGGERVAIFTEYDNGFIDPATCYEVASDGSMSAVSGFKTLYDYGEEHKYYAFYPYEEGLSLTDYLTRPTTLVQNGSIDGTYATSAETAAYKVTFHFVNIYSKVIFNFVYGEEYTSMPEFTASLQTSSGSAIDLELYDNDSDGVSSEAVIMAPSYSIEEMQVVMSLASGPEYTFELNNSTYISEFKEGRTYTYDYVYLGTGPVRSILVFERDMVYSDNITKDDGAGAIESLLSQFRRCLAQKDAAGNMMITYLDNNNTEIFPDGSEANIDGSDGDVMVYFPEFWYKYESLTYDFRYYISETEVSGYTHVPASLVGAYKAYVDNNGNLTSVSGIYPDVYTSYDEFEEAAALRGDGYQIIDYNQHCVIAMMLYAKYEDRDIQAYLGVGGALYDEHHGTGSSNSLGNADTAEEGYDDDEAAYYVSGLGIEGVYGGYHEWVSGVVINGDTWTITNVDGSTRSLTASSNEGYITVVAAESGPYFDMVPTETSLYGSTSTYYTDYFVGSSGSSNMRMLRSWSSDSALGGVSCAYARYSSTETGITIGSRLAYRGAITELSKDSYLDL